MLLLKNGTNPEQTLRKFISRQNPGSFQKPLGLSKEIGSKVASGKNAKDRTFEKQTPQA
ncbi:MAG: hypothetical protein ACI8P3_000882 [Saprospiraceae bacterium]